MDMDTLARCLSKPPPLDAELRGVAIEAAVVAILKPLAGGRGHSLLFIRRSESQGDPWSGHMALPGGRVDPSDAGAQAAAVREAYEEVGIDLVSHGRCLGRLSQVASPPMRSRVVVTPYVWLLQDEVALKLDPREVASAHWFDLDRWLSDEGRGTFQFRFRGSDVPLPRVDLDGHRVWGMTLRVVDDLLERVRAALLSTR